MKTGMNRKTGSKYIKEGKLPSELKPSRTWRTRSNPFEEHWSEIELRLQDAPELEAKTIFDYLVEQYPDLFPGVTFRQADIEYLRILAIQNSRKSTLT